MINICENINWAGPNKGITNLAHEECKIIKKDCIPPKEIDSSTGKCVPYKVNNNFSFDMKSGEVPQKTPNSSLKVRMINSCEYPPEVTQTLPPGVSQENRQCKGPPERNPPQKKITIIACKSSPQNVTVIKDGDCVKFCSTGSTPIPTPTTSITPTPTTSITPTPTTSITPTPTTSITPTPTTSITPTPTTSITPTPTTSITPTPTTSITPTPTTSITPTPTTSITPTPTPAPTPTPTPCTPCYFFDVNISQLDLNDAFSGAGEWVWNCTTSEWIESVDNKLFITYTDCYGECQFKIYNTAQLYEKDICADQNTQFDLFYYKNGVKQQAQNSDVIITNEACRWCCDCFEMSVTINQQLINDATGNSDTSNNNKVYYSYINCEGTVINGSATSGTNFSDCVKYLGEIYYFKDNNKILAGGMSEGSCCKCLTENCDGGPKVVCQSGEYFDCNVCDCRPI